MKKLVAWAVMGLFLSAFGQWLWRLRMPRPAPSALAGLRVAVLAHVFYPEQIGEILACRDASPVPADLLLTTVADKADQLRAVLHDVARTSIHVRPNRGRDIAPFIWLLQSGALSGYDAVLKLHTKKSPHLLDGRLRRRLLFTLLAGPEANISRILRRFLTPGIGMVGWRLSFRRAAVYWMLDRARVETLAAHMRPPAEPLLGFFEGSMFWFRPAAFSPLTAVDLPLAAFEPEAGQIDGTLHHAIERCFCIAARAAGYATIDISGRVLMAPA